MTNFITILHQAIAALPENSKETRLDAYGQARHVALTLFKDLRLPAAKQLLFMHALETAISSVEATHRERERGRVRRYG